MTTLSVILPVYNESATVAAVIDQVLGLRMDTVDVELIVVESGSTDGTRDIVMAHAGHPAVTVVLLEAARGKGWAVRKGLQHATGDVVLIQDGDLEYRIDEYPLVLAPLLRGEADFVLGTRYVAGQPMREFKGERRLVARLVNAAHWGITGLFNVLYRTRMSDPLTMFKVFRRRCIDGVPFVGDRFDFDMELVAKLIRLGHIPVEVPITYESRGFKEGKKVRFFRDPPNMIAAVIRFRFARLPIPSPTPAPGAATPHAEPELSRARSSDAGPAGLR